jgi:hypothetical protein
MQASAVRKIGHFPEPRATILLYMVTCLPRKIGAGI